MDTNKQQKSSALVEIERRLRRLARSIRDGDGVSVSGSTPLSLDDAFEAIRDELRDVGLLCDETLVLIARGGNRIIYDAQGQIVGSSLFDRMDVSYAVFTAGQYSREYAKEHRILRASCDDMAQMFGPQIPCGKRPWGNHPAFLVEDEGFVATGRYPSELIAAAVLVEKACRTEMLAPTIGAPTYLNPLLCAAEHAVYLASYSKPERKEHDGEH